MTEKLLVTYASVKGYTTGIARVIGDVLRAGGAVVHVLPLNQVSKIEAYHSVVLGSPVYEEHWPEQAVAFLKEHRKHLSKIPIALFIVTTNLRETPEEHSQRVRRYVESMLQIAPELKPVDVGMFTGAFDSRQWQLSTLLALKAKGELPLDGDYRDWSAIRAWAAKIRPYLIQQPAAAGL